MKTLRVIFAIVVVGLVAATAWWWFGVWSVAPSQQTIETILDKQDSRLTKGDQDANIQMTQYIDMMCVDCARAHQEVMPRIEKEYVDTGKLRYEVRIVSKIHHADADEAANGAYCAAEQDKLWAYLDLAYEKLRDLPDSKDGLESFKLFSGSNLRKFAQTVGLNVPAWEYCVAQESYSDVIDKHESDMSSLNAYGTPHSVINGSNYNGAPPYNAFKTVIDAELKKRQEKK